jgi:hypothetical protein
MASRLLCTLAVSLSLTLSCGKPTPPPAIPEMVSNNAALSGATFFSPGETFEWRLKVARIEGGQIHLALGEPGMMDERKVIIAASRVEQSGLGALFTHREAEITSWIDVDQGTPIRHRSILNSDKGSETIEAEFFPGRVNLVRIGGKKGEDRSARLVLPNFTPHNILSFLLVARNWAPPAGTEVVVDILANTRVWRASLKAGGFESIATAAGTFRARRIDATAMRLTSVGKQEPKTKKTFSIFYSADDLKLPLLARSGSGLREAELELMSYRNGAHSLPSGL